MYPAPIDDKWETELANLQGRKRALKKKFLRAAGSSAERMRIAAEFRRVKERISEHHLVIYGVPPVRVDLAGKRAL